MPDMFPKSLRCLQNGTRRLGKLLKSLDLLFKNKYTTSGIRIMAGNNIKAVAISGSLRLDSYNRKALRVAEDLHRKQAPLLKKPTLKDLIFHCMMAI